MRKAMWIIGGLVAVAGASYAFAAVSEIEQVGQRFSQGELTLAVGDVVHFNNHDDVTHNINVIDGDGSPEDEGLQKPGETITKKFDKAGTYTVRCAIHPRMKMTVTVK